MNFSPEDVEKAMEDVKKVCRGIRGMQPKMVEALVSKVVTETLTTNKAIEDRIEEAGLIPGDVATVFMHYGAIVAIVEDLPITDDRRELVAAGRELGKMLAAKYGEMVRDKLEKKSGKGN